MENIYKKMIEDSPIGYIHIKINRDENNLYRNFYVVDFNKASEIIFNIKREEIISEEEDLTYDKKVYLTSKIDRIIKDRKVSIRKYIKLIDKECYIDIYSLAEDNFYISLTELDNETLKLSKILRNSPFFAWTKDKNGRYVDVNDSFLNFMERGYEEIIGRDDSQIWGSTNANRYKDEDESIMNNNTLHTYEEEICFNNKKIYVEVSKWPYVDKQNNILGIVGIAKDIGNVIELRKSIKKNEENFLQIANNIEEVFIMRDDNKAIYVSPSFEKLYKVTPEEMGIYEDINNWNKYWDKVTYTIKSPDRSINDGVAYDVCKLEKKGQEDIWIWSKFIPVFDENGNIIKSIGILGNITKEKKVEEDLQKIKMDFLANLSHELRTPINLIMSSNQVLNLKMNNLDEETFNYFNKYLSIINQNSLRLLKLVNNLIDTTKMDSGHFLYNPKNNNIVKCIEEICLSVANFIELKDLNIIFDTNEEEKIISFDQDNMERIMLNLLSNAIKFSKEKGTIYVNVLCDKDIRIEVIDEGIGIPQNKIKSIFRRFEQVSSDNKKEKEGSGIGLSLVKSLVEMHRGSITIESEVGVGSKFIIVLPNKTNKYDVCDNYDINNNVNITTMSVEFSDIYI